MERKGVRMLTLSFCLMAFILAGTMASAEDASPEDSKWEFIIVPYLWMVNIDGDVTAGGIKTDINLKFGDILRDLDFGGEAHMEAWKGRWGLFLDATYLKLTDDGESVSPRLGPVDVDVDIKEWLVEFGGFYRLASGLLKRMENRWSLSACWEADGTGI